MKVAVNVSTICDIRARGFVPRSLTQSKGVIYNADCDVDVNEIVEQLPSQKVIHAERLLRGKKQEVTSSV